MQGHVIVCGLQGVGLRAVEQFSLSGTPVVVIDDDADPRRWRTLGDWGVPHVRRHAHRGEGFEEAGLARAAAVVCVEVDEIHTLETALRIKEIRPDLPLVVQLANPSVAGALERVSGPGSVLDVASLAAPSFVEACLLRPSHAIELAGVDFAVVQLAVESRENMHDTFRAHFGHLAPVAIMPVGDGPMEMCPGRDHPLHAGTGWPSSARWTSCSAWGSPRPGPADGPTRSVGLARRIRLQVGIALEEGNRALAVVATALFALIVVATIVLHYAFRPDGAQLPPRLPLLPVLHRGDRGDRRLRGLQLLPPEPVAHRLRHRPHRRGRGPRVDRVRALHQHSGEPPHRAVARAGARCPGWWTT